MQPGRSCRVVHAVSAVTLCIEHDIKTTFCELRGSGSGFADYFIHRSPCDTRPTVDRTEVSCILLASLQRPKLKC
eukprot:6883559-Prymnesium_polylepis.1